MIRRNSSKADGTMFTKKKWKDTGKKNTKNSWIVQLLDCPSGSVRGLARREAMKPPMAMQKKKPTSPHHPCQNPSLRRKKKNPRKKRKKRRRKKKKSNLLTHTILSEPSAAR